MIKEFGKKTVIDSDCQYTGTVVEYRSGEVVARDYGVNEYGTYIAEVGYFIIDLIKVQKMKTELSKVREISRQLGDGNYVISAEALDLIAITI